MNEQRLLKRKRKALLDGNKPLVASLCADLGELYFEEARFEEAVEQFSDLAETYKSLGKELDYARANRKIGEAYMHLNLFEEALKYQDIYLRITKEENDKEEEQRALATIGHTYITSYLNDIDNPKKESLDLAHKFLMKSLVVCESLTNISKHDRMDMSARLFANLGVVEECQGNYDKGIELVEKSISICKSYDLYDQLERSYTQLGSLYFRKKEYNKAIAQYNLAIETAGCLKDKTTRIVASLLSKAEILVMLLDFRGAKLVLLKAYKMKSPNTVDHETVLRNLKIVAAMCYTEDSLLITSETDYKTLKTLYEKMGDGACELKIYSSAIHYYKKMLEAALKAGESGKALSPCYISLAQTYKDNKEYELSLEYFYKEYDLCKANVKEAVTTLLDIAETMELANKEWTSIDAVYKTARNYCQTDENKKLEGKVISKHIAMLRKHNGFSEASELESELNDLDYIHHETESEGSEVQTTPNIGDDICISDITDISDGSDAETDLNKPRTRRARGIAIKKNIKGETQLHTACISGNSLLVKQLLQQKHPVNIRDNAGWLPLHEACLYGHLEIVEMLVAKGAAVNDRGGTNCSGRTPLHDAAINGHLEVVQFLLDHGAYSTVENDDGETPLYLLKNWRAVNQLEPAEHLLYESLIKRMTQDLERSGKSIANKENLVNNTPSSSYIKDTATQLKGKAILKNTNSNVSMKKLSALQLQRSSRKSDELSSDSDDDIDFCRQNVLNFPEKDNTKAAEEYKLVMESLRYRSQEKQPMFKKRKSNNDIKTSAYIEEDEVGDDWLEDDLGINTNKKRKTGVLESIFNTASTREKSSLKDNRKADDLRNQKLSANIEDFSEFDTDFPIEIDSDDSRTSSSSFNVTKKGQTSLTDSGFSYYRNRSSTNSFSSSSNKEKTNQKRKHQTKITNFPSSSRSVAEADSTTDVCYTSRSENDDILIEDNLPTGFNTKVINDPVVSVDVRIDGKLYRVPITLSETHKKTIKWLAEEAAKRYARKEFMRPLLDLETKNGAILAEDDFVSILFPAGNIQSEEVQARIVKWDMPSLVERYRECCLSMSTDIEEDVVIILQETSTTLNLNNLGLRNKALMPLCKALNRQSKLYKLNLSGNFLSPESINDLCNSLPSLENLTSLDLSSCHIDAETLNVVSDMFVKSSKSILENLSALSLSFNPLTDRSLKYLAVLTRFLKLESLDLKAVDFTSEMFNNFANKSLDLCFEYIKEFSISYNSLEDAQIKRILSWINSATLESLDVSNNVENYGIVKEVIHFLKNNKSNHTNLKKLNLSRCCANDSAIDELLSVCKVREALQYIDLSYNDDLTSKSLTNILECCSSLKCLDLAGCNSILNDFDKHEHQLMQSLRDSKIDTLRLSINHTLNHHESELFIKAWQNKYSNNSKILMNSNFLEMIAKGNL